MAKTGNVARFAGSGAGSQARLPPGTAVPLGKQALIAFTKKAKAEAKARAKEEKRLDDLARKREQESVVSELEEPPQPPLHVSTVSMDVWDVKGCRTALDQISRYHSQTFVIDPVYHVVPLMAAFQLHYPYPPLMPLALATPREHFEFDKDAAFKLLFCPRGINGYTSRDLVIEPPFYVGDFQSNAHTFFTNRFTNNDDVIKETIDVCSSIWVLALVLLSDDTWTHQIIGGIVYSNYPGDRFAPRTVYIELLAIQQSDNDYGKDEISPEVADDIYSFEYGDDKFDVSAQDCAGAEFMQQTRIGSRRLGVLLLVLVQELYHDRRRNIPLPTSLFIQCPIRCYAYRRLGRLGFKYSLLHQYYSDMSINPWWPLCQDVSQELPLPLSLIAQFYCFGPLSKDIRLFRLDEYLSKMYPPIRFFGTPMADQERADYFQKWRFTNPLPDPVTAMSINYSPSEHQPDICHYIKLAMKAVPPEHTTRLDLYDLAQNKDEIAKAFKTTTVDYGTGYGIDHSIEDDEPIPFPFPQKEVVDSKACYWQSAFHALFGCFYYGMAYYELKISILDMLDRIAEIDPSNDAFTSCAIFLRDSLYQAKVRTAPKKKGQKSSEDPDDDEDGQPVDNEDDVPPTPDEIHQLVKYDMNDMNMVTTFSQSMISNYFLSPRLPNKVSMLMLLTVEKLASTLKKHSTFPKFVVRSNTLNLQDLEDAETAGTAQHYAIVNIYAGHYINLIPPYMARTWEHYVQASTDEGMCRQDQSVDKSTPKKQKKTLCQWKNRMSEGHDLHMQLQYMCWDGEVHWGKISLASTKPVALNPQWVEQIWKTPDDRQEWMSRKGHWVKLSAGEPRERPPTPPLESPTCQTTVPIAFPQFKKTCLASSFASALYMAGHHQSAAFIDSRIKAGCLQQGLNLTQKFLNLVNSSGLQDEDGNSLVLSHCSGYDILLGPTPAAVILEGTDFGTGHAIALCGEYVIDPSWPVALPRTRASLDWACFPAKYKKPSVVYTLSRRSRRKKFPRHYPK